MAGIASNLIKDNKEQILRIWEERALAEVGSAASAASLALRNSIPIYLDHLGEALATNRKMDFNSVQVHEDEAARIGQLHGEDRASTSSYVLKEVIFEYHILREVIFQMLEKKAPLGPEQRDIILDSIEKAVNDAAVKFSEVHADIQEKFTSTLTHDLKTPLSAAKLNAQLILKRANQPDDCLRLASRIINNLNRLDSMIHDLLDASRLRAGERLQLQLAECDIQSILNDVMDDFSVDENVSNRLGVTASTKVHGLYDSDGLRRALENLIGNAVKYSTPKTPISATLRKNDSCFELAIHNYGPGIPPEDLELLFQQYRRAKSKKVTAQTGWGLGLTLVKGVAEAHGGEVLVESDATAGTTFTMRIPLTKESRR